MSKGVGLENQQCFKNYATSISENHTQECEVSELEHVTGCYGVSEYPRNDLIPLKVDKISQM